MKTRKTLGFFVAVIAAFAGSIASTADAALVNITCTVTSVGWRQDMKALKVVCGGQTFWNRETAGNPTCTQQTPMDTVKLFQTTAHASYLAGKSVSIWHELQGGCNTGDRVIREMYLF